MLTCVLSVKYVSPLKLGEETVGVTLLVLSPLLPELPEFEEPPF
jgi:hypothetical protein